MSLVDVKPYFRSKLKSLDYKEWTDGFNFENIPDSLLHESFHLEISPPITGAPASHIRHVFSYPITVRVFLKSYLDPKTGIDDAISRAEEILQSLLVVGDRLGADIKDIIPNSINPQELATSNDNSIILEMAFTAVVDCVFK